MQAFRYVRDVGHLCSSVFLFLFASLLPYVSAADDPPPRCSLETDTFVPGDSPLETRFTVGGWLKRGACIRSQGSGRMCYITLQAVLEHLIELRKTEYSGASGILSLLPTIGALLGAPTNEIWTLMTILPFGGVLALALSFGSAIMPVGLEDYEHSMMKGNISIGSVVSFRAANGERDSSEFTQKLALLDNKISDRISKSERRSPPRRVLFIGLFGMSLLFIGSQAAMGIVETGGVISWWCGCRWWMHGWYLFVTASAIMENYAHPPFRKQRKLYVSLVPYELSLNGGEFLHSDPRQTRSELEAVEQNLKQMKTMRAARVFFTGSTEPTESRNSVIVMISVVGSAAYMPFFRLFSKTISIAIFVAGTSFFASATLVAFPIATLALALLLGAGIFSRAIAGWMVRRVAEEEPMVHVIVNSQEEANHAILCILKLKLPGKEDVQVEIDGHVFVNGRRVATRSWLHVAFLGVLASPYDLVRVRNLPTTQDQPQGESTVIETLLPK